jgi:hypothetical protein
MSTEILRAHRWPSNAAMIAEAVVPLGYITGDVLDATYGLKHVFWKQYRPESLTTNDLNAPADHAFDFRHLPDEWWGEFETVVFDPPYKLNGTPAMGDMDNRFGTADEHGKLNREGKLAMILGGALECWRLRPRWLLVKCMDQVEGGKMRWVTMMATAALGENGARLKDRFDLLSTPMAQPPRKCPACRGIESESCETCDGAGKVPCRQDHARANYSSLLVFTRG